jgi:hypothetical protein
MERVVPPPDKSNVSEAELSALADGSLTDPDRRAELHRQIDASPELTAVYEHERRVVLALSEARSERAPQALRLRIERERPTARKRVRLRIGYGVGLAGGLAAALLVVALALPGGPGGPSVSQAAALALKGSVRAGPAPNPRDPNARLSMNVRAVYFPNWGWNFGWKDVGQRIDSFYGRKAVTVYYKRGQQVVAYTILDLPALRQPAAAVTRIGGVDFRTLHLSGRIVVTWRRGGQTCVLSGAGVSPAVLRMLAAWDSRGLHDGSPHAAASERYRAPAGSAA